MVMLFLSARISVAEYMLLLEYPVIRLRYFLKLNKPKPVKKRFLWALSSLIAAFEFAAVLVLIEKSTTRLSISYC